MRQWCRSSIRGLNIAVDPEGLENIPEPPFVYCSNHQSLLDILVLGAVLPHDFKWAAKRSLMRIPFLGWHLALAGHVPVDRSSGSRAAAVTIERFVEVLRAGKPLLVFPEGTRSEDGVLRSFKAGGFYAAVRGSVPVVPVAIDGTHRLMKKGALESGDGQLRRIAVRVGPPLRAASGGDEASQMEDLRDRTRAAISAMLPVSVGGAREDEASSRWGRERPQTPGAE